MSWYAIDAVDDALDASREFLFPFSAGRWARLLVVVFFLGIDGSTGLRLLQQAPDGSSLPADSSVSPETALVAGAVLSLVVVVLMLVSSIMRFVLIDALGTDEVALRRGVRAHFWKGARLLGFTVGLGLLLATVMVTLVLALGTGGAALLDAAGSPGVRLGLGLFGTLVLGLVAVGGGLAALAFYHVTLAFVAPTMLVLDTGVLNAWARVSSLLRAQPWQFLLYLLVRVVLGPGVAIATGIPTLLGLLVFGVLGVLLVGALSVGFGGPTATLTATVLLAVGAVVLAVGYLVLVALPLRVLGRTYLTTYQLDVLGEAHPGLAVLPDGGGPADDEDGDDGGPADDEDGDDGGPADDEDGDDGGPAGDGDDGPTAAADPDDTGGFEFLDPVGETTNDEPGGTTDAGGVDDEGADDPAGADRPADDPSDESTGDAEADPSTSADEEYDVTVGTLEDDDRPYWAR